MEIAANATLTLMGSGGEQAEQLVAWCSTFATVHVCAEWADVDWAACDLLVVADRALWMTAPVMHIAQRRIPYVVIGPRDESLELQAFAQGACDYLPQPLNPGICQMRLMLHVQNKRNRDYLESLSLTDPLTSLANRRRFDDALFQTYKQSMRSQQSCALVSIDVDHFKHYNDTYGHLKGDLCLKRIARVLDSAGARPFDVAARVGGEEFCVILPDTHEEGALQVANRILSGVRELAMPHSGINRAYVSVSVGVAVIQAGPQCSLLDWPERADRALYQAKANGRDQVVNARVLNLESV